MATEGSPWPRLGAPRASGALLGGLLFLLLLTPGFLQTSSTFLYSEVIEPREVESRTTFDSKEKISYIIKMEDDYRLVHLKRISFIASNMPVYSYNMKGDLIADYPYIQDDCYYSGYVEGALDSQVVLSTCTGLWGHVQIGTLRYEIEPIENSPTFQHHIYRKTPREHQPCQGVVEDGANLTSEDGQVRMVNPDSPLPSNRGAGGLEPATETRYLEYYLVVDKSTFIAHGHNETLLVLIILNMMSAVHAIYLPIDLHVYLVGLELWSERDYITIGTKSLAITLDAFYKFARNQLQHHVHFDHAGIITAKGHPSGLSWGDRICHYNHLSVSAMRTYLDLRNDAEVMAHQLGHSLGFPHDDTPSNLAQGCDCKCSRRGSCLMVSKDTRQCARLSNCSQEVYYEMIRKPGKECLLDMPTKIFRGKVCGNGVTEEDEDCDCGVTEDIEGAGILSLFLLPGAKLSHKRQQNQVLQGSEEKYLFSDSSNSEDMAAQGEPRVSGTLRNVKTHTLRQLSDCRRNGCCQENCKSKPDIDCLYGSCCEKCKFSEEGTVCREAMSECDLPEYCNGTSAECPPDLYKQDGMPCSDGNSCFLGDCLNLHKHCIALFGKDAQQAPLSCFKELNMRGDQSGNCGGDGETYIKCNEEDVLCGRLQCIHIKRIPKMSTGQGVIQTPVEDTLCWGTEFHLGRDSYDLGAVKDGTTCGADKICLNRSCVDLAVLDYNCDFSKCNNHGVCNNNGNCHCTYGWAPPFCAGKGYGGSIDSGPPSAYGDPISRIIGFVTLAGLVVFMLGLAATFKKKQLGAWFAEVTQKKMSADSADTESIGAPSLKPKEGKLDLTSPTTK
ncbi:disintegrin and metalloproteinase domain-containing protein 9-like isoform X2 [Sceloporus undulatus]|uniref:disintegrin and metalloproteinase domain-containing protein 9-like isoform X2 n=1 Tax=Sceloporus undulatus TaxID=8520 RepID=UPI001C4D685D|nr:disintegrin and metalloproteinase domain-containing protein 9-like isoform X2 [Sceloporus undulatus]